MACSDGSTLDAHKVILSSVSTYFRDILKTAPCKHPIIILKDTCKDEASAMLEFAYTGEVFLSKTKTIFSLLMAPHKNVEPVTVVSFVSENSIEFYCQPIC